MQYFQRAKNNRRWERDYVTFDEKLKEEREEGRKEGREEGQELILALNKYLIRQERYDDLKRASEDPEFRAKLLSEIVN